MKIDITKIQSVVIKDGNGQVKTRVIRPAAIAIQGSGNNQVLIITE